jgi:hypothetical protein
VPEKNQKAITAPLTVVRIPGSEYGVRCESYVPAAPSGKPARKKRHANALWDPFIVSHLQLICVAANPGTEGPTDAPAGITTTKRQTRVNINMTDIRTTLRSVTTRQSLFNH